MAGSIAGTGGLRGAVCPGPKRAHLSLTAQNGRVLPSRTAGIEPPLRPGATEKRRSPLPRARRCRRIMSVLHAGPVHRPGPPPRHLDGPRCLLSAVQIDPRGASDHRRLQRPTTQPDLNPRWFSLWTPAKTSSRIDCRLWTPAKS